MGDAAAERVILKEIAMLGQNFPVSEYYRKHIVDARTIARSGTWWNALLAINEPSSGRPFLALYKWQRRGGEWKKSTSYKINSHKDLAKIRTALDELESVLAQ